MKTKVLLLLLCLFNGPVNADQWQDQPADSQLYLPPALKGCPLMVSFASLWSIWSAIKICSQRPCL